MYATKQTRQLVDFMIQYYKAMALNGGCAYAMPEAIGACYLIEYLTGVINEKIY